MIIRRQGRPELRLGYEMNVHPSSDAVELCEAIARFTLPVARRIASRGPFGIVPHIGEKLVKDLTLGDRNEELREALTAHRLFPFSVNAFPLSDFHAERVKEKVYLPSWAHKKRAEITNRIADRFAELLPEGEPGTISTLGGAYRATGNTPHRRKGMAKNYLLTVAHLARIEREYGVSIILAAEPEPDTTFEVAEDVTGFLEESLLPQAREILVEELGIAKAAVEETVLRHFGVNLDVCHAAVMFRDPVSEWRAFERVGLRVAKLHLTNALALPAPGTDRTTLNKLIAYQEPRYLHQCVGRRRDGSLWRGADLPELAQAPVEELEEVRVHFHVPLSRRRLGGLRTTRDETAEALGHALEHPAPPHLVIETYTWPYFTGEDADAELLEGIHGEFQWVLEEMRRAQPGGRLFS